MRYFVCSALGFLVLLSLVFGCSSGDDDDSSNDDDAVDDDAIDDDVDDDAVDDDFSYPFCDVDETKIDELMGEMSLKQKIAQMYVIGVTIFPWFEDPNTRSLIEDMEVGGVFVQPLIGVGLWPEWTVQNVNRMQSQAMSRPIPIPLFITVDQEGGIPQTVNNITGGTDTPGNMGLGATFDPHDTYLSYNIMGQELAALGINAAFSPVAELMITPDESSMYTRCFGERTEDVTAQVPQAVRGLQENLIIATAKHFPSHSTAPGDEHFTLPVNNEDEQAVRTKYIPPFIAAIDAGTDMIMATHAVYTAWEDDTPTTFSYRLLTQLLREELGYAGLIVTDDINMGSITLHPCDDLPDVLAIAAGADVIVDCSANNESMFGYAEENLAYPHDVPSQIDWVIAAVQDGRLSAERIDESVRRILRAKMKYCLFEHPYADLPTIREKVHTAEQIIASFNLHERAMTLVRNDEGLLPLDPDAGLRVHVVCPSLAQWEMYPDAAWGNLAGTDLLQEILRIAPTATGDRFMVGGPLPININRLVNDARDSGADILIVGTYNALYYEQQTELVRKLLDLSLPTIVVATGMPYDLLAFPGASTYLATYSNRDIALAMAAQIIFGFRTAQGRLPVSLPGLYDVGWSAPD